MNNLLSLEPFISSDRASTYRRFSPNSDVTALSLYCWNVEISSELFKVIGSFEVYLRNSILKMMENAIPNGIFNVTFLGSLKRKHKRDIFKVIKKIDSTVKFDPDLDVSDANPIPTLNNSYKGTVVAEMSLFFWEDIFTNVVASSSLNLIDGFPYLPPVKSQSDIKSAIYKIRMIRNRICHNEHLLNENISAFMNEILEVISYISPQLAEFERNKESVSRFLKLKPV